MNEEALTKQQIEVLRYVRDHSAATVETIAREVLGAPVTTFGRTLRLRASDRELAALVRRGLLEQTQQARHAELLLTKMAETFFGAQLSINVAHALRRFHCLNGGSMPAGLGA